jgi:cytoskeletal protein CcmA (bactofilin family)
LIEEISAPSVIAEGTKLQGEVTFESAVNMCGIMEGDLIQQSSEVLQIGRNGFVHGNIRSQGPVLVEGRVEGDIVSMTAIVLSRTCIVRGHLTAPKIEMRPGALLDGEFQVETEKKPRRIKRAA